MNVILGHKALVKERLDTMKITYGIVLVCLRLLKCSFRSRHRRFRDLDPTAMPGVLVAGHAPFCWGEDAEHAAHNAVVLEAVARMAYYTAILNPECKGVSQALLDRHYFRKHGAKATYGQES